MDKRTEKRHKRQVARAREKVVESAPDLRTPEEIKAAREASRPAAGQRNGSQQHLSRPATQNHAGPSSHSKAKTDAGS